MKARARQGRERQGRQTGISFANCGEGGRGGKWVRESFLFPEAKVSKREIEVEQKEEEEEE